VSLDQRELVSSAGVYASDAIPLGPRLTVTFGVRGDRVRFEVEDRLITVSNPDDSGVRSLGSVSPVAGIVGRIASTHALYANISTAFETPTATELGNHEDGSAGINPDLDPQRSVTAEAGVKGWFGGLMRYDASVFRTGVRDELVPFEIPASNGRRYFRNAGRTIRKGLETGAVLSFRSLTLMAAYTWSHFRFDDYSVAATDFSGNVIPGIPVNRFQAALRIDIRDLFAVLENESSGKAWLDDANTVRASAYSVTGFRTGWRSRTSPGISVTTGLRNIFDRVYASSLVVNAARGKYYEPAPGRTFFVGVAIQAPAIER
jgi:iron complex outermembrane receptor protein